MSITEQCRLMNDFFTELEEMFKNARHKASDSFMVQRYIGLGKEFIQGYEMWR